MTRAVTRAVATDSKNLSRGSLMTSGPAKIENRTIRRLPEGRRAQVQVLVHRQCGNADVDATKVFDDAEHKDKRQ